MCEKKVKLGVVGLGRGRRVVSSVVNEKNVTLTAICDRDPEKLTDAIKHFEELGVKEPEVYDDFDKILKSDIDVIFIATDAICHVPYAIKALEAGKHVISEIPAINSLEEARQLLKAVKSHPELKYFIAENCCYWAFIETWKKMYEEGSFGDIIYAESEYLHDMRKMARGDGHWRNSNPAIKYLTHNLGPLLYIMDDEVETVTCMEGEILASGTKDASMGNAVALFKTKKGAVIRILICFDAPVGVDHNFRLIGTKGTIETDSTKPLEEAHSFAMLSAIPVTLRKKIDIPVSLAYDSENAGGHGGADKRMMIDFINCIIEDRKPILNADFAIKISLPGILAHESAVQGNMPLAVPLAEDLL